MVEQPPVIAAPNWLTALRPSARIGRTIEHHETIGSTNDRARELLADPDADGAVVVADEQTAGRGRRGRTWVSPPGTNLLMSVVLHPRLDAHDAWQLGFGAALAAAAACAQVAPVRLKWPNDLVDVGGRKLGGLLVETVIEDDRLAGAVLGIGINVNWGRDDMPPEIAAGATSLANLRGDHVDRASLLADLLERMEAELDALERGRSPLERYRAACATLGAMVVVATPERAIQGRAVDLDGTGGLVIEGTDGTRTTVAAGEVLRVKPGGGR